METETQLSATILHTSELNIAAKRQILQVNLNNTIHWL